MPIFSNHHSSSGGGGGRNRSKLSEQQSARQRESPSMILRRRLGGGNQRVAPLTTTNNGVDHHHHHQPHQPQHQQHQRHVAISHFGQQHHSSRPSAWVIPFDSDEIMPYKNNTTSSNKSTPPIVAALSSDDTDTPPLLSEDDGDDDLFPIITPDRPTPCTSNTRRMVTVSGIRSNNRGLHNSHRKTQLHHITPRETHQSELSSSSNFQLQQTQSEQQQQHHHRGNGVVLDLTSLFSPDAKDPHSPSETATTVASTNQQQQQPQTALLQSKSPPPLHYNAPTPPPWRSRTVATSPVTVISDHNNSKSNSHSMDHSAMDNSSTVNVFNKDDLQWDSKSQTTQEALLTERQCQALTQWLNFVLVGEQHNLDELVASTTTTATSKKKTATATTPKTPTSRRNIKKVGASCDTTDDDTRSRATTPTHGGRSTVYSHTPSYATGRSTTRTRTRASTPTQQRQQGRTSHTPSHSTTTGGRSSNTNSRSSTPTQQRGGGGGGRSTTPLSSRGRGGRSVTPTPRQQYGGSSRAATPTPSEVTQPAANNNNKNNNGITIIKNRRRYRRLSLFQYGESYEHAQDQAHHWFQHSPQWKELRRRIRCELAAGKLTLRDDRNLYANVGCRDILLELFCSYKPAWLTMALEVVMNDHITPPAGHALPSIKQMKHFIIHRVLMDTKLLSKYTQGRGSGTPSGKFEQAFQAELQPLVLYRILVLVFFLDRAAVKFQAQNNQLGNLFLAKSKVKSTAQVLVLICREFLSRQGDIIKQLARVNLHVYYKQHRLDEIEYPIVNFAIDLRDGVRLCRVVEVLWLLPRRRGNLLNNQNNGGGIDMTVKYPLLHQLRIPAISRLQKIHNVNVALTALQDQCQIGLPSDLQAHHIVDGQRRMVMCLVWTIVLMHCFENTDLLTRKQVEEEIVKAQALRRHHQRMQARRRQQIQDLNSSMQLLERESDYVESVALVSNDASGKRMTIKGRHNHHTSNLQPMLSVSRSRSASLDEDEDSTLTLADMPVIQQWKGVLFQWCQQVCMLVDGMEKANGVLTGGGGGRPPKKPTPEQWTTTDLANGKALCCLIHHYHPSILPLEELRLASRVVDGPPIRIHTNSSLTLTGRFRHMRHQRRSPKIAPDYYMRLAQRRLTEIGGIPNMMLLPVDKAAKGNQRKRPSVVALGDEKSTLVFLYHVCGRLIESRHQVQAVVFVQQRYRYLRMVTMWRKKLRASKVILDGWRENKSNYYRVRERKYGRAVRIIEAFVSRNFCKLLLLQEKRLSRELENLAITPIQALVRRFLSNLHLHSMLERQAAAIKIQARFRQFHEYNTYQILLLELKPAATVVQRHWRGFVQRRKYASIIDATIRIQTFWRSAIAVQNLHLWHGSAMCIQRIWRGFWTQLHYQMDLMDIIAVQSLVRKQQAIQSASRKAWAVGVLQRKARKFLARECLKRKRRERRAAITIQKTFRKFLAMGEAEELRAARALLSAALVVQRSWRRFVFLRARELAVLKIQTQFRMWTALRNYAANRGALRIQTQFRMWIALRNYARNRGALRIQTQFRMWIALRNYSAKRASTLAIQTHWRQFAQRQKYCALVKTVIFIQSCLRGWKYGLVEAKRRRAALQTLQKHARRWLAVRLLNAMKKHRDDTIRSAIVCQALTRRNLCSRTWKTTKLAILTVQANWRRYWCRKTFRRRQELLSALSTCELSFRHLQKGSFKIVPLTRQVVLLSKQTMLRCGKKRIVLSNAFTWVVPWRGHRQKLFRHRSHVKAVRVKYSSGVQLRNLPRRLITLRILRSINEAARRLQAPWTYPHLKRCGVSTTKVPLSKDKIARIRMTRRTSCARKLLSSTIESKARRTVDAEDAMSAKAYQGEMRRIQSAESRFQRQLRTPTRRLRHFVNTSRVLNLANKNTTLSLGNKSSVQLFEDPFKKKIKMNAAAKIVQKYWRRFNAKTNLRRDLRYVVIAQNLVRRYLVNRLYRATRASIVLMQSTVRGFLVRQRLKKQHKHATTLQRYWRGAHAQSKFKTMIVVHRKMLVDNAAATKIQTAARGLMVRRELVVLQACALIVQRHARGWLAREQVKPAKRARMEGKMASKIQHTWKGHRQRVAFLQELQCIVTAQSAVRRWFARRQLQQLLQEAWEKVEEESAVKIQAAWRSFSRRIDFMFIILCLIKIQSWWRPIVHQKKLRRIVMGIVSLQASVRGAQARRMVEQQHTASTTIQSKIRVFLAKRTAASLQLHVHAKTIQSCLRRFLDKKAIALQQIAVVSIQRSVRGFLVRQQLSLANFAATEIQRIWRGYDDASGYIYVVVSAIKIQSFFRMAMAKKMRQELLLEQLQQKLREFASVTSIQSLCRRMSAQKLASDTLRMRNLRHESATKIQSTWRMALAREHASELARAILEQEIQREKRERQHAALFYSCATRIQSIWRMALARKYVSELIQAILEEEAILKLQCLARMVLAKNRRAAELSKSQGIASPPKVDRLPMRPTPELLHPGTHETPPTDAKASGHPQSPKAAMQPKARKPTKQKISAIPPHSDEELHRRLSLSQGLVRGFLARRQSNPAVREVQILIKEAELRSKLHPSMRLGARMGKALQVLKTSQSLNEIMNVVCTIELATRFSRECCAEFVQAGATEILVSLLYDLNKSLPHVELLYYLMRTLLNVCKYHSMVDHVANVETAKAFLHLIRMYGSEDAVFCSAVSLLEVCASRNEAVRALIATPASRRRMEGICQQWERKLNRRLALESPSSGLSTPQRLSREAPSQNVYTPQFMSKRNKAKTDMLILGISYDLQNGVATFRQVLSRTI